MRPENDELGRLPQNVRGRLLHGMTDDPVQGRLHRAGGDLEWLQEIRANADGDHDRDEDHFHVFPPDGILRRREMLGVKSVQLVGLLLHRALVPILDGLANPLDLRFQIRDRAFAEDVAAITKQLLCMANEQPAVFYVTLGEHGNCACRGYCARRTWMKASCGMLILPMLFMRFLPSFCFSSSFRLRVMSPP